MSCSHIRARHGDFSCGKETRSSTHGSIIYSMFVAVDSEHFKLSEVAFGNLKAKHIQLLNFLSLSPALVF